MTYSADSRARRGFAQAWRLALPLVALALAGALSSLSAQVVPTPEGTVIVNEATVSYTDANGNAYADEVASVSVTVGFQGGLDVVPPADVTPASPSTGNTVTFSFTNNGNGSDTVAVNSVTTGSGNTVIDNITYEVGGVTYPDLASLNAALATTEIPPGGSLDVTIVFDVPAGTGGLSDALTVDAGSIRNGGDSDVASVNVSPALQGTISVTDAADQDLLPGTGYSITFPVTNSLSGTDDVELVASLDGTNAAGIAIVSIDGVAGTTVTRSFTAGETQNITIVFDVGDFPAGSVSDITLTATANSGPSDAQTAQITIIRPALAITKGVFLDAGGTTPVTDDVLPGQTLYYVVTVENTGSAPATNVTVTDDLDPQLQFVSVTESGSFWDSLAEAAGVVTATKASFPIGTTASFVIEVTVQ